MNEHPSLGVIASNKLELFIPSFGNHSQKVLRMFFPPVFVTGKKVLKYLVKAIDKISTVQVSRTLSNFLRHLHLQERYGSFTPE